MDEAVVRDYVARLESGLGETDEFGRIVRELRADARVRQIEAVAIASRFVMPMPTSTTKANALAIIQRRQDNLALSDLKRRAVRGRSAA